MNIEKLSIIIPAFNEASTIHLILEKINNVKLNNDVSKEIIIINDCSTDNTLEIVTDFISKNPEKNILVYSQNTNLGKGAAINKAIELCTGDYVIFQDADLEYEPNEYNLLLKPVFDYDADVVYGSRFMGNQPHRILFFWHSIGNKILTFMSNIMNNLNLTDMETCYKLIRNSTLKKITIKENRFGIEPEITAKLAKIPKIKIFEVGISYNGRTYDEGKKIGWKDGFRAIFCIIKYKFFD